MGAWGPEDGGEVGKACKVCAALGVSRLDHSVESLRLVASPAVDPYDIDLRLHVCSARRRGARRPRIAAKYPARRLTADLPTVGATHNLHASAYSSDVSDAGSTCRFVASSSRHRRNASSAADFSLSAMSARINARWKGSTSGSSSIACRFRSMAT